VPGVSKRVRVSPGTSGSTRFDVSSGQRKVATGTLVLPPSAP
jgi:3-hydroxyacyl-[acyl-carrier-protein] dehydratase